MLFQVRFLLPRGRLLFFPTFTPLAITTPSLSRMSGSFSFARSGDACRPGPALPSDVTFLCFFRPFPSRLSFLSVVERVVGMGLVGDFEQKGDKISFSTKTSCCFSSIPSQSNLRNFPLPMTLLNAPPPAIGGQIAILPPRKLRGPHDSQGCWNAQPPGLLLLPSSQEPSSGLCLGAIASLLNPKIPQLQCFRICQVCK